MKPVSRLVPWVDRLLRANAEESPPHPVKPETPGSPTTSGNPRLFFGRSFFHGVYTVGCDFVRMFATLGGEILHGLTADSINMWTEM
jgi:hypothetical protein